MKRFTLALVFAVVAISGTTISLGVSAQEILLEGPLAGAPAVRKLVQYRRMRFSVGPQFSYTLKNEYMHNFLLGLRLQFDFTDWFGIGAIGYYGFNAPTKLTKHIRDSKDIGSEDTKTTASSWPSYTGTGEKDPSRNIDDENFPKQIAKLKGVYLGQLSFTPFRGKMALFEKLFVAIDMSIFVGGGAVHFQERAPCSSHVMVSATEDQCGGTYDEDGQLIPGPTRDQNGRLIAGPTKSDVKLETHFGGTFTWGVNFVSYFNDWAALNLEFRMTPFKWNAGGTDEAGQSASTWEYVNRDGPAWEDRPSGEGGDYPDGVIDKEDRQWYLNMSIGIGVLFYFPLHPKITE